MGEHPVMREILEAPLECGRYDVGDGGLKLHKDVTHEVGTVRVRAEDVPRLLGWLGDVFPDEMDEFHSFWKHSDEHPTEVDMGVEKVDYFLMLYEKFRWKGISGDKAVDTILKLLETL